MSCRNRFLLALGCALAAVVLTVGGIAALGGVVLWHENGVAVCTGAQASSAPQSAPDGEHGMIVVWQDDRTTDKNIYAQRVDHAGNAVWLSDGISVCVAGWEQHGAVVASDGAGGAFVAWTDYRLHEWWSDIWAQRIQADGTAAWVTDGISVCTAGGSGENQWNPRIVADGAGGAILAWIDERGYVQDIYAQRLHSDGTEAWTTDGVSICAAAGAQASPQIATDGDDGAIVVWTDQRGADPDIYAQRVCSDGTRAWATDGVTVCAAAADQLAPQVVADGSGGAIVVWDDRRSSSAADIYAQRVYSDGTTAWTTDGVTVCARSDSQINPQAASDGAGGAIVIWQDHRWGNYDIYAQRVCSDGTMAWVDGGKSVCGANADQTNSQIVAQVGGGAIATWQDYRSGNWDVYARAMAPDGTMLWQAGGIPVCTAAEGQGARDTVGDGAGGALVAWQDGRSGDGDIYAQRVGTVGAKLPLVVKNG